MFSFHTFLSAPCFALYRFPDTAVVHAVCACGAENIQGNFTELSRQDGFVAAPFDAQKRPILFIPAERRARFYAAKLPNIPQVLSGYEEADRDRYMQDFVAIKQYLAAEICTKLVLARRVNLRFQGNSLDILQAFGAACKAYPHNYVALWHTPQSGTWLTATPELLLSRTTDGDCHTMALAGTMPASASEARRISAWSAKNLEEQRLVQQHITHVLDAESLPYRASRLKIVRSGDLLHLRTDFNFATSLSFNGLLDKLHPTPAVCGMKPHRAKALLAASEQIERDYYAGYSGPIAPNGAFAFYVTLRCFYVTEHGCDLFAGGGVLPQSEAEDEWLETERKLDAMRRLMPLSNRKF